MSHLPPSNILAARSAPRMQITCGFSVKGCIASRGQEERNLIPMANIPPCVAHTSVNPLSTHIVGIAAGGESAVHLALWGVMGTLLMQASLRHGLIVSWKASEWESHLEIIVDYIKLSQGQTFFSERPFPPEGLLPRTMARQGTLVCSQQVAASLWILLSSC